MKRIQLLPNRSAIRETNRRQSRARGRRGATLSEALVALLIMAIGVISLASLFPISVLKTAKANQLTVATGIRYNAEAMIRLYPWIIADPNPADTGPNRIPDGNPFNDYDFAGEQPFLFDPLGLAPRPPLPAASGFLGLVPRFGGGFSGSLQAADKLCGGPDTWSVLHDNSVSSMNTALTNMTLTDLANVQLPAIGSADLRVQIFFNGGKNSVSRNITAIQAGNTLVWTEDVNGNGSLDAGEDVNGNFALDGHALPGGIVYESARLEARERRYSWLLNVRPQDVGGSFSGGNSIASNFDVSVVVFYGREFSVESEQAYGTAPANAVVPPTANIVASSAANLVEGQQQFVVSWPAGQEPFLKRGGYVFDAVGGYWYQIENYVEPQGALSTTVKLTTTILEPGSLVVFPRGVVDVFPLRTQSF